MPKEVFISYSSKEREWANQICKVLELNQISYWIAPDCIPGGSNYTTEIPIGIKECAVFMILVTDNSVQSPWVRKELDTAITEKKLIIPLIVEGTEMPPDFSFLLNGVQHYSSSAEVDPTSAILDRIKKEIRDLQENSPPKTPEEIIPYRCPKCGFENINDDYHYSERTTYERLKEATRNFWMMAMPLITSLAIYIVLCIKDLSFAPFGKSIIQCGIIISFVTVFIKFITIYYPEYRKRKNLRWGFIEKHVSCCRCGHRFILRIPADTYVYTQK